MFKPIKTCQFWSCVLIVFLTVALREKWRLLCTWSYLDMAPLDRSPLQLLYPRNQPLRVLVEGQCRSLFVFADLLRMSQNIDPIPKIHSNHHQLQIYTIVVRCIKVISIGLMFTACQIKYILTSGDRYRQMTSYRFTNALILHMCLLFIITITVPLQHPMWKGWSLFLSEVDCEVGKHEGRRIIKGINSTITSSPSFLH